MFSCSWGFNFFSIIGSKERVERQSLENYFLSDRNKKKKDDHA